MVLFDEVCNTWGLGIRRRKVKHWDLQLKSVGTGHKIYGPEVTGELNVWKSSFLVLIGYDSMILGGMTRQEIPGSDQIVLR